MRWHRRRRDGDGMRTRHALSCHEVARLLQSYLDGELDDLGRERVVQHLDDCRRCGLEAETYRAIKDSLVRAAPELPPEPLERLRAFADDLASEQPDAPPPSA